MKHCAECRFWKPAGGIELEPPSTEIDYGYGDCRKRAPFTILHSPGTVADYSTLEWPTTKFDDWCGDFERRFKVDA